MICTHNECMWLKVSVATNRLHISPDPILINCDNLNVVSGIDIALSNPMNDIFGDVFNNFLAFRELLHEEVVTVELTVKNRDGQALTRSLATVVDTVEGADSIVAHDYAFTGLGVQAAEQVESIIRHESTPVKHVREQLGKVVQVGLPLVLHHIDF